MDKRSEVEISVIVPVYKVEKYLRRCTDSILRQTYDNFELILVDDGSPDSCGKMCEEIAKSDGRVKVIHKENGGLSDARNAGMQCADGKYITFIDSDDYVTNDYLMVLHELIVSNNADVAVSNFKEVTDKDELLNSSMDPSRDKIQIVSSDEALYLLLETDQYIQMETAWGKLIRADIACRHPFPKGRLREDEATTFLYYVDAQNVAVTSRELYGYYQNPASIMHSGKDYKRIADGLWAITERAKALDAMDKKVAAEAAWFFTYGWLLEDVMENPSRRWDWKETYEALRGARYVRAHIKEKAYAYMHFPHAFRMIQKIRGKV